MGKYFKIVLVALVAALLAGCIGGKKTIPAGETSGNEFETPRIFVFAETPVVNIDSDMLAERFGASQRAGITVSIDSLTVIKAVYDILVDSILGQDAANYDLKAEQPSLYRQYLKLRYDKVMRLMFQKVIVDSVTVSDSMVRTRYDELKESFLIPEKYRARHIVISGEGLKHSSDSSFYSEMSDEQLDSVAQSQIERFRERILEGDSFDTLAMLYSQDEKSAPRGGDLGYFILDQMVSPFDSTVENTPVGTVSGIIKTQYGWHVVRVDDHVLEHYAPLDSVYQQMEAKIKEEGVSARSRAFMDSIRTVAVYKFDTTSIQRADSLHEHDDILAVINPDDLEFGNDTLYFRDYQEFLYNFKKYKRIDGELGFEDKIELITNVGMRLLLVQAARTLGYDSDPGVEEWAAMTIKKYSVSSMRKRLSEDDYMPTEEEMRAYYDSHLDDYVVERPLTVQHIVFADSNIAEYVRDLLMSGVDFMDMVDQYYPGEPEIKRAASDLGDIGPNDMPSEFYAAAKRTAVGEISHPVKTVYGYHLIKVLKKTQSVEFERAEVNIKAILKKAHLENKLKNFVDSRLVDPPVVHWDLLKELYYAPRQIPNFSQFKTKS